MKLREEEATLKGQPISRGIAIGKPFFLNRDEINTFELPFQLVDTEREIERYRLAISRSKQDLKRLQKQLEIEAVLEGVSILDAQLEMLQDPVLTTEIEKEVKKSNKNVEFIFQQMLFKMQEKLNSTGDPYFIERFNDLKDLAQRIFSYLHESGNISLKDIPPHSIVCAQELTASDAAEASIRCVEAFVTAVGGATSHAAIVAKAKGLPYITQVNLQAIRENANQVLIIDGRTGDLILNPTKQTLKKYERLKIKIDSHVKSLEKNTQWPSETYDGYAVHLSANVESVHEIGLVHQFKGAGIGLFRSEYIFLPKGDIPPEDEQFSIYRQVIEEMRGLPVVIRTFDLGGDKVCLNEVFSNERGSFLGGRATRFLLKEREIFITQLRAILRASVYGPVSILFPMISTLAELRAAKQMLHEAQTQLGLEQQSIKVGCMIEVPSAALNVDHIVKECDFLSIGTNDLVQYSLVVDRGDHLASEFYEPTDLSVIRLIKLITSEADQAKIPVTVCGEIASDPRFTALLLGLGVQELSVTPRYLPLIKNAIRKTSIVDAVYLAEKALTLTTAQEILELLVQAYQENMPQDLFYNSDSI